MEPEHYKAEFEKLQKKYDLPNFLKLAEDFDIEKSFEKDSSFILREIRRAITERIGSYAHFFESLLNPMNPPMFFSKIIRNISTEDRESIKELYQKMSSVQLKATKIDVIYSEEAEADYIKEANKEWQGLKKEIKAIIDNFKEDSEEDKKKKDYFG